MAQKRRGIGAQPHKGHMAERELTGITCKHRPAGRQNGIEKANDADVHDVVIVARRIDERQGDKERHDEGAQQLRDVLPFQNLPCAPLANFRPKSPIGRSSSMMVRMIIP